MNICRIKNEFDSIPSYIYDDIDNWSMTDFVNVRNGTFVLNINTIIQKSEVHVFNCEVGSAICVVFFTRFFRGHCEQF